MATVSVLRGVATDRVCELCCMLIEGQTDQLASSGNRQGGTRQAEEEETEERIEGAALLTEVSTESGRGSGRETGLTEADEDIKRE